MYKEHAYQWNIGGKRSKSGDEAAWMGGKRDSTRLGQDWMRTNPRTRTQALIDETAAIHAGIVVTIPSLCACDVYSGRPHTISTTTTALHHPLPFLIDIRTLALVLHHSRSHSAIIGFSGTCCYPNRARDEARSSCSASFKSASEYKRRSGAAMEDDPLSLGSRCKEKRNGDDSQMEA
jgi:hypothetical protein